MNKVKPIIPALLLTLLPTAGWCSLYTCKPPGGTTIFRAEIPLECGGVEVRELNPDGSLKRVIPAPLTEEQKKQNERREGQRQACIRMNQHQSDEDMALQGRYEHEEDLQEDRYNALGDQLQRVDRANARMKQILAEGMHLTQEAMFYQPPNQKPDELLRSRNVNLRLEKEQLRVIRDAVAEIGRINENYDDRLQRYRTLISRTAKMPCDPALYQAAPSP